MSLFSLSGDNNRKGWKFQPLDIHSPVETKLFSDPDEVNRIKGELRRIKGETMRLWWTSGDSGQWRNRERKALVPEDTLIS